MHKNIKNQLARLVGARTAKRLILSCSHLKSYSASHAHCAISSFVHWSDTPQGISFWGDLDTKHYHLTKFKR